MTLRTVQTLLHTTPLLASNKFAHLTYTIKVSCLSCYDYIANMKMEYVCVRECVFIMETLVTQCLPLNLHCNVKQYSKLKLLAISVYSFRNWFRTINLNETIFLLHALNI